MRAAEIQRRASEIFQSAISLPAGDREGYLDKVCDGNDTLRAEVTKLVGHWAQAGSFLETPAAGSLSSFDGGLPAGSLVAGRYRIESQLGYGGMGEVYQALDTTLQEHIALKLLRVHLAADPSLVRRFQREIQLVRRITHPNICRLFDAGVDTGETGCPPRPFFTMQLLQGETLAQRFARARETGGGLPKEEAVPLILQIAGGVAAAHRAGIIHRDLKPSNVILTRPNRDDLRGAVHATITDFGLARLDETRFLHPGQTVLGPGTLTLNSQIAGTVAYMSPEQITGGAVTAATDIYSLGIILYEMATGQLPFPDRNLAEAAFLRNGSPPDPRKLDLKLDRRWAAAIVRCLQTTPAKRFANAEDIVQHFASNSLTIPLPEWTRRRWLASAGVVGISAVGLSQVPRLSRLLGQDAKVPEGAAALLSPVANLTGDPRFDGITELFRNQIGQSVHLNLIDRDRLATTLKQMGAPENSAKPKLIQQAAWRANASLWISGTLTSNGTGYALNIHLETRGSQPNAPKSQADKLFPATDDQSLMRSVGDAGKWVRQQVGESPSSVAQFDRLPTDVTTSSWEALRAFQIGLARFTAQDYGAAQDEFEEALRLDPQFSLAAIYRADLLHSRNQHAQSYAAWKKAISLLDARPATRQEELHARAMFAFDSGDIEANDRYCRIWQAEYPANWRAPYSRINGLILLGHARQALDLLESLRRNVPEFGDLYSQTIAAYLVLGDTRKAREYLPPLRQLNYPERATQREAFIRYREGDIAGYLDLLGGLQRSKRRSAAIFAALQEALLWVDVNAGERANQSVDKFLRTADNDAAETAPLRMVQAWGQMIAGATKNAARTAEEALNLEAVPVSIAHAGTIFARCGMAAKARDAAGLCTPMLDLVDYRIAQLRILGEIARARQDGTTALKQFRSAATLEPVLAPRDYLAAALPELNAERLEICRHILAFPWQVLRPPSTQCLGAVGLALSSLPPAELSRGFARATNDFRARYANN